MRYETQVCSVGADGRDIGRDSRGMTDSILRENEVLAVRRPVLLDRDTETEGGKLEWVAAIDVRDDQRRSEILSVKSDEAEFLAIGRNIRVGGSAGSRDPLP